MAHNFDRHRPRRLAAFFVIWWIVALSPFLLLGSHQSDYYPAYPAIGLFLAFGTLLGSASGTQMRRLFRWVGIAGIAVLCWTGAAKIVTISSWYQAQSGRVDRLLAGIREAQARQPDGIFVINTIEPLLFLFSFRHIPETALRGKLLLAPAVSDRLGTAAPSWLQTSDTDLNWWSQTRNVTLYDVGPDGTVKPISGWSAVPNRLGPSRIRAAVPDHDRFFGKGWFDREEGGRWMGRSAVATLESPLGEGSQVSIHGWLPSRMLERGPLELRISVDGKVVCTKKLATAEVVLACPILHGPRSRETVSVGLDFDREIITPPDVRGLSFFLDFIELSNH